MEQMNSALGILKNRYSCRQFSKRPIEQDVLDEIIEVGLSAASGGNLQPVSMVVVRDEDRKKRIRELCKQGFIEAADTLVVFLVDYYRLKRWTEVQKAPFGRQNAFNDFIIALEDVMCIAQSMECAANLLGVGNVYIGTVNYYYEELKEMLDLPELTIPILMTCFGYPEENQTRDVHLKGHLSKKLARQVVVHDETYQTLSDEDVKKYIVEDKYNNWMQKLEGDVLERYKKMFFDVASQVNGHKWADEVVHSIEEQGGINRAQFRLGYHYNPVRQQSHNSKMFAFYQKQGFNFLLNRDQ